MPSSLTKPLALAGGGVPSKPLPRLIYGTAWKKARTQPLVHLALSTGFRALDTAAQPRHYAEPDVASALREAIAQNVVARRDVFVQTKFTPLPGQDPDNVPYDASAPLADQVRASVEGSLRNFAVGEAGEEGYIDCLLLHSPLPTLEETLTAWATMASFVPERVRRLGISNVSLPMLRALCDAVARSAEPLPKPAAVQNRLRMGAYEPELYAFCQREGIVFEAFWTLSANPNLLASRPVAEVAAGAGVGREVAMYALLLGFDHFVVLDGTTSGEHMREDLEGLEKVGGWADGEGAELWKACVADFKVLMGCEP
ncbi:related to D-xylose reductase II,III protein [Cephalotrichum gorgonifer]|uniref:Related to D-xylose reductase II,III protein n=1 Tax=Cephalotrichum gorgonifer TaxID=2041049 RepID=A0AAE8N259_9PEZI|nr:related to D-xylose reductase II,III protein [Cephalotrichum gorgonifer]